MKIQLNIADTKSIKNAISSFSKIKKRLPKMIDSLLQQSCLWIKKRANSYLNSSGLNSGFISEIKHGWQEPTKQIDGSWILTNYGRGYSVEFGIGIKGEGTYDGDVPDNYKYNIRTGYKADDGSWVFKINDINTLDIKQDNVIPNSKTGEINYEEGRTIRTQGQQAIMFCYNSIIDFKTNKIANKLWEKIKGNYLK